MSVVEKSKSHEDDLIINQAIEILKRRLEREVIPLHNPQAVKDFCFLKLADREHEVFSVIYLDSQNCVLAYEEVFFGSISSCSVYPREIVKSCLYKNSANIFVCHNHPSGGNLPSEADKVITKRLQEALSLIDVTIIDHLIIGGLSGVLSFREQGLI